MRQTISATSISQKIKMVYVNRGGGYRTFVNPPYGRQIGEWVKKAAETVLDDKSCVVMLLPARTDTKWFHDYIANNPRAHTVFLKGRLKFGDEKQNAPFPSMIVVFA